MDRTFESLFVVIAHVECRQGAQWIAHMPQSLQLYQPRYQTLSGGLMDSAHAPTFAMTASVPDADK